MDPGEHRRQDALVRHPVDDPGGHDHVDKRPVGDRDERDAREQQGRERERAPLDYLSSGPLDAASWPVGTTIEAVKVTSR